METEKMSFEEGLQSLKEQVAMLKREIFRWMRH